MTNVLKAINNIIEYNNFELDDIYSGKNRMNNAGEALEVFIKDAFAQSLAIDDFNEKIEKHSECFSWLGNQNNPPDAILHNSDAIEVKKIASAKASLALNSSYPKAKIFANSPMITAACRACENWTEKDLIYCVGHVEKETIKSLWIYYGDIYAATDETYLRIKNTISQGIESIEDVEFAETKELGRVNRIDPLGITNLRIRGMWQIQNPRKVFSYLHEPTNAAFELICIIPIEKYNTFDNDSIEKINFNEQVEISDVSVKNPNNPANLIPCKLLKYTIA